MLYITDTSNLYCTITLQTTHCRTQLEPKIPECAKHIKMSRVHYKMWLLCGVNVFYNYIHLEPLLWRKKNKTQKHENILYVNKVQRCVRCMSFNGRTVEPLWLNAMSLSSDTKMYCFKSHAYLPLVISHIPLASTSWHVKRGVSCKEFRPAMRPEMMDLARTLAKTSKCYTQSLD